MAIQLKVASRRSFVSQNRAVLLKINHEFADISVTIFIRKLPLLNVLLLLQLTRKTLVDRITATTMFLERIPCRLVIAFMIFWSACINYTTRVNLSVNLVAMVPVTNQTNSSSQYTLDWTTYERAQVLSSFFWGYFTGSIVSLLITDHVKPRITLITIALMNSVLTLISPVAAKQGYIYLVVIRVLMGIFSGSLFPILFVLVLKWAVETEKNRFVCLPIAGTIGTFVSWVLCGLIIDRFGWEWGFYSFGIASLITTIMLYFCVFDTPEQHPRITKSEVQYIKEGIKCNKSSKRKMVPYFRIFTSIPCLSLFILEFGLGWGIYFVITAAPQYLSSALGYKTSSTSFLSALIYLTRCSSALIFGYIGDIITKRNLMSLNVLRKTSCFISYVVPGCAIFCMSIQGYSPSFYICLIVLAMGLNGCTVLSSQANQYDLTKNYIGTLGSMTVLTATTAGIITPYVTAFFIHGDETNPTLWRPVFFVGAGIYILTGLQFLIFGSTKIQPWDHIEDDGNVEN